MSVNKPRLGLEALEAREVPAVVFVGGWGTSAFQQVDPNSPNVVYVGGSARSVGSVGRVGAVAVDPADPRSTTPSADFPVVDAKSQAVKPGGFLNIRDSQALGPNSRDQFVFAVEMPTAARDFPLDVPPIKGESSDEKNKPQPTGDTYSAIAFVGGWGSSSAPSAPGSLGFEVHVVRWAGPMPVLLVIADQQDFHHSTNGGAGDNGSPVLRKGGWVMDVALPSSAGGRVSDDVVVDGRIITGENFDTAASSGYIRIKKLNSGG